MKHLALWTLCAWTLAAPAQAEGLVRERLDNWPNWRGPEANGTAPTGNPPITWDANKNIKWKAPLTGSGSATPIVWGDQVFVLTAVETDRMARPEDLPKTDPRFEKRTKAPTNYFQFVVESFDRQTGKLRWQRTATEQVPHEGHHPTHSYAAGSPTTDGKYLYVSFGSRGTYCYDLDGNLRWQRDLGHLNTRLGWGEAVTPVVHGDSPAPQLGPGSGLGPDLPRRPDRPRPSGKPTGTRRRRGTRRWWSSTRARRRSSSTARSASAVTT